MVKKQDRHQLILRQVSIHNRVLLQDLARMLDVSNDTIRRDIKELDAAGKLKKVHGGAISNGFQINIAGNEDQVYALKNKTRIAKKAVKLIPQNAVVLISGGTTNLEFVRHLPKNLTGTFFTPSLPVALELLNHPLIEVIFIGGRLSKDAQIAVGPGTINTMHGIRVDLCFLGTGYLDIEYGLTEFDWEVVQMKKAMIGASKQIISLSISEKLNSVQRYQLCDIQTIDTLVTELAPDAEILAPYRAQEITII